MERKEKLQLLFAIIVLAIFAIPALEVLVTEIDRNLRLLASGILLSILIGGWNMIRSIFKNAVAEELKKANKLNEQKHKHPFRVARNQLKSCLENFMSVGSADNIISLETLKRQELQREMSDVGTSFKTVIENIEKLLLIPSDILNEAKSIAKLLIKLTPSIARSMKSVVKEWDELRVRAKKLIEELEQEEVDDK